MAEARQNTVLDTGLQYLGTVYAKALIGAAEKSGSTQQVLDELDALGDVLQQLPTLEATLNSPRVGFEAKESLLEKAFRGRMSVQMINFLKVLARHGRFSAVRAVRLAARRIFNDLRGILEVYVTTAEPIDKAMQEMIAKKLQSALGRNVDLRVSVDPNLLGGLLIRVGDTVYDGSLANQLSRLRNELVSSAATQMRSDAGRFAIAN